MTPPLAIQRPRGARRLGALAVALALAGSGCECGSRGGSREPPPAGVTGVTVEPGSATVLPGATQQFVASVEGTASDRRVTWSLQVPADVTASPGTISGDGLYTAPALAPAAVVTVVATSVADPTRAGRAPVEVPLRLLLSPADPVVLLSERLQLHATVLGCADQHVSWSASYGSVDGDGVYTPAATLSTPDVVTAWSVACPAAGTATLAISVRVPPPVLADAALAGTAGDVLALRGSGFIHATSVAFPAADGGELLVPAIIASQTELHVEVPPGAASGPLAAELSSTPPVRSAAVPLFHRIPRLRLWPARRELAAGESVTVAAAFLGGPPEALVWSADVGTAEDGVYRAPGSVGSGTFARVTACVAGTASCAQTLLAIAPFRIAPDQPLVAAGGSVTLAAVDASGPVAATWRVIEGNGTLSGATYTAPSRTSDASRTRLEARVGDAVREVEVAVTGLAPGLLHRVYDLADLHETVPRGTYFENVAVRGSLAYVLAADGVDQWGSRKYLWLDVFDVSNPRAPAWIGAVESPTHADALVVIGDRLLAIARSDWSLGFGSSLAVYDLREPLPVLVDHAAWDPRTCLAWDTWTRDGDLVYASDTSASYAVERLDLRVHDVAAGAAPVERLTIPLPRASALQGIAVAGGRLYVGLLAAVYGPPDESIAVYDLRVRPPALLGEVAGGGRPTQVIGDVLYAPPWAYDLSSPLPVRAAEIPVDGLVDAADGRAVAWSLPWDLAIFDATWPAAPERVGMLRAFPDAVAWTGTTLLAAEGAGGLAVYDVAPPAGPAWRGTVYESACYNTLLAYDAVVHGGRLYAVGNSLCGFPATTYGEVAVYDLSTTPPTWVASALDMLNPAASVEQAGNFLFVAHAHGTIVYDAAGPGEPIPVGAAPIDEATLALSGDLLFAAAPGRLVALDVRLPTTPVTVGEAALPGTPLIARVSGDLLAIALGDDGLAFYDVSFPDAPLLVSHFRPGVPVLDVALLGEVAAIAAGPAGVLWLDVADPSAPTVLGGVPLQLTTGAFWPTPSTNPPMATALTVRDGLLYVGSYSLDTSWATLEIHDVRDPRRPALVSLFTAGKYASAFAWNGPELVIVGSPTALLLDVSRPRNVNRLALPLPGLAP